MCGDWVGAWGCVVIGCLMMSTGESGIRLRDEGVLVSCADTHERGRPQVSHP